MIRVYYTYFDDQIPSYTWEHLLLSLPIFLQEKVTRYKRWQDRHAALLGKLLLREALFREGIAPASITDLSFTRHGRPYLPDYKGDFNISHSESIVVCAITPEGKVGIDIERKIPIEINDFLSIFNSYEWHEIQSSRNSTERFYHYWTLKESVLKADGRGLALPLETIYAHNDKVLLGEKEWTVKKLNINNSYACFVATDAVPEIRIELINIC